MDELLVSICINDYNYGKYLGAAIDSIIPAAQLRVMGADTFMSVQVPFFGPVVAIQDALGAHRVHGSSVSGALKVTGDWERSKVLNIVERKDYLAIAAEKYGHKISDNFGATDLGSILYRMVSLRLDPKQHPTRADKRRKPMRRGLGTLWRSPNESFPKRILLTGWFVAVGFLPPVLARPAIGWLFAPQSRPGWVKKVHFLVNSKAQPA